MPRSYRSVLYQNDSSELQAGSWQPEDSRLEAVFWCPKKRIDNEKFEILRLSQYSNPVQVFFFCDRFQFTGLLKNGGRFSNLIVKGDLGSSCLCVRPEICVNLQRYLISVTVLLRTVWPIRQVIQKEGHKMLEKMLEALFFILCCKML